MDISDEVLNVISKDDAVKLLMDFKDKKKSNNIFKTIAIIILFTLGMACILASILSLIFSPIILLEWLLRKIYSKKELQDESSYSTD